MKPHQKVVSAIKDITTSFTADPKTLAQSENAPSWINQVAMLTGALAALTGFLTVRTTMLTNEAIYESNQAILSQTQASDAWSEYQADSIKAHIATVQMLAPGTFRAEDKVKIQAMEDDFRGRQPKLKETALQKEQLREDHLKGGLLRLQEKDLLGYAGMAAQLGIALASVAALVRKRTLLHIGAALGALAVLITAYVFLQPYFKLPV